MNRALVLLSLLAVWGCGQVPNDPDGTLERVRREGSFRVGVVAAEAPLDAPRQHLFLRRVAGAAGARPAIEQGGAEPLLMKLEEGELDLVLGEFAPSSPWATKVSFLPPLSEQVEDGHTMLLAAAPNGENAWIGLLYGAAKDVAGAP